jgi:hypothetical protein
MALPTMQARRSSHHSAPGNSSGNGSGSGNGDGNRSVVLEFVSGFKTLKPERPGKRREGGKALGVP